VTHASWGTGRVLRYEGDTMTVLFGEAGYRTLSVDLVNSNDLLQPAPDPTPTRPPPSPCRAMEASTVFLDLLTFLPQLVEHPRPT
jgi:hypothetical protein